MRLSDEFAVVVEAAIPAPPERVWELVADISTSARFSPELQRTEWLQDADGPAVGAHFAGHNARPDGYEWQVVNRITEFTPNERFGWSVLPEIGTAQGDAFARWYYELTPEGAGTRVRHGMRMGNLRTPLHAFIEANPDQEEAIVGARLTALRTGIEAVLAGIAEDVTRS
ncbi:SRPBCC family protein [Kitasatospora sp. NPDC048407]|uniref:SRPBCC family protein n=1 Tax=Kitasatospora sp. NPDC048407 TaxID=3364051 RepID=UPI0037155A19